MTAPPPEVAAGGIPSERQRREIIRQVGIAIGELAKHLSTNARVADGIADVTLQAKAIAFKAWQVMAGGRDAQKIATELAEDLDRLAADMVTLAGRAGHEAVLSHDAASVLAMTAAEFDAIAEDTQTVGNLATLRARLRPLLDSLDTIPNRLVEGKSIAQAFSEGARKASLLAVRGKQLRDIGRPGQMLQAVYDGMTDLADQTSRLSTWIAENGERGQAVAMRMAVRVEHLSKPSTAPERPATGEKMSAIIGRGAARVW